MKRWGFIIVFSRRPSGLHRLEQTKLHYEENICSGWSNLADKNYPHSQLICLISGRLVIKPSARCFRETNAAQKEPSPRANLQPFKKLLKPVAAKSVSFPV